MGTVYDKAKALNSENFKLLIGVKKETFQLMLDHLNAAYQMQHQKRGTSSSSEHGRPTHPDLALPALLSDSTVVGF